MKDEELKEIQEAFRDQLNYDADDINAPIDPLTYHTPEGDSCLHIAALRGDLRLVKMLLDAGLDVNEQGDMGYTPLHNAKRKGFAEIVDLLIEKGADTEIVNEFGKKPLDL